MVPPLEQLRLFKKIQAVRAVREVVEVTYNKRIECVGWVAHTHFHECLRSSSGQCCAHNVCLFKDLSSDLCDASPTRCIFPGVRTR
jgi:hypothetical protein